MTVESLPAEVLSHLVKGAIHAGSSPEQFIQVLLEAEDDTAEFLSVRCGVKVTAEQLKDFATQLQSQYPR